jgi:hypothetical protein
VQDAGADGIVSSLADGASHSDFKPSLSFDQRNCKSLAGLTSAWRTPDTRRWRR